MKVRVQILMFLLVTYGGFATVPHFVVAEKITVSSPFSASEPAEQETSDAKENFLVEDESFIDLFMISFFKPEDSIHFYYTLDFKLQGSPAPPFSPPELYSC